MNPRNRWDNVVYQHKHLPQLFKKFVGTKIMTLAVLSFPEAYFSVSSGYIEDLSHRTQHQIFALSDHPYLFWQKAGFTAAVGVWQTFDWLNLESLLLLIETCCRAFLLQCDCSSVFTSYSRRKLVSFLYGDTLHKHAVIIYLQTVSS